MPLLSKHAHGPAADLLWRIHRDPGFRHARFEVHAGKGELKRLILGIGQMHPVLQGKFEGFQAHRIAAIQAWIFQVCLRLTREYGVHSFGQEGLWSSGTGAVAYSRIDPSLLDAWAVEVRDPATAPRFLRRVSDQWRKALRRGDADAAARQASALNGQALVQALEPGVSAFPLEQQDVHGVIGSQIDALHREADTIEQSAAFRSMRAKGGRGLTQEEYSIAVRRNALIKAFNALLTHPERDRSIFREVMRAAEKVGVTVFVLGQAHRSAQLRLAREHGDDDLVYAWVTPPQLWRWEALLRRALWTCLGIVVASGALWFAFLR